MMELFNKAISNNWFVTTFSSLTLDQLFLFFLLSVIVFIIGTLISHLIYKHISKERLDNQDKVISLKKEQIDDYEKFLEKSKNERVELENRQKELIDFLETIHGEYKKEAFELQELKAGSKILFQNYTSLLEAFMRMIVLQYVLVMIGATKSVLFIYMGMNVSKYYSKAPPGFVLEDKLNKASNTVEKVLSSSEELVTSEPKKYLSEIKIPRELSTFNSKKVRGEVRSVLKEMVLYLDRLFAEIEIKKQESS